MNSSNVHHITLILKDKINVITINVNKNILCNFIYFNKLLTNFLEAELDEITIDVPNCYVTYDIIINAHRIKLNMGIFSEWKNSAALFNGAQITHTKYILESIKCYDFFGLNIDKSILNNLKIPPDEFDELLHAIELIGFDDNMIKIIAENIPTKYDLSKLSKELLDEIVRIVVHQMDSVFLIIIMFYKKYVRCLV